MKIMTATISIAAAAGMLAGVVALAEEHKDANKKSEAVNEAAQTEKEVKLQTTCPVMGGKINKDLYVDVDGKRIYVCCKDCIDAVRKNPQKYIEKLEEQGVTVEQPQTTCPVMGGKINKDLYVDVEGKRVYVCCKGCIDAVKKNPEKYIEKLEKKGVTLTPAECRKKDKDACRMNPENGCPGKTDAACPMTPRARCGKQKMQHMRHNGHQGHHAE